MDYVVSSHPSDGQSQSSSGSGSVAWNGTLSDIEESNDKYVSEHIYEEEEVLTYYLYLSDFKFNIPSTATIKGIRVNIEGQESANGGSASLTTWISKDGSTYSSTSYTYNFPNNIDAVVTKGSESDLWGFSSITPAEVNSSSFKVRLRGNLYADDLDATAGIDLDFVTVSVYYEISDSSDTEMQWYSGPKSDDYSFRISTKDTFDGTPILKINATGSVKINDVLKLQPRSSAPPNPVSEGTIYFNSNDHKLKVFSNGAWRNCN